jgi:hypothetical protein
MDDPLEIWDLEESLPVYTIGGIVQPLPWALFTDDI